MTSCQSWESGIFMISTPQLNLTKFSFIMILNLLILTYTPLKYTLTQNYAWFYGGARINRIPQLHLC